MRSAILAFVLGALVLAPGVASAQAVGQPDRPQRAGRLADAIEARRNNGNPGAMANGGGGGGRNIRADDDDRPRPGAGPRNRGNNPNPGGGQQAQPQISIEGAVARVRSRSGGGRLLDAGTESMGGRTVYRVRWSTTDGRRVDYIVDARSGAILREEG